MEWKMGYVMNNPGKMIYGVDFYVNEIDDSQCHFWLQYENEENRLIVDKFGEIDLGLPKETHKITENTSGINAFYGRSEYGNRTIQLQTYWAKEDDAGVISRRRNFLIDFFTGKSAKLYFYIYIPQKMRRYKVEVKPSITGEKYSNLVITNDISITLTCASVFFESEDFVSTAIEIKDNKEKSFTVINDGYETSFKIKIKAKEDFAEFMLANSAGGAFRIKNIANWTAGSEIIVDTGDATISVGGVEQLIGLSDGTFFNLTQGENLLYYQGGKATIEILYREKMK
jgi:hypothetical protein